MNSTRSSPAVRTRGVRPPRGQSSGSGREKGFLALDLRGRQVGGGRDGALSFCRRVLRTPGHHSPDRLRHCPHLPPVSRDPAAQCPGEHGPRGGRERGLSPTAPSQTSRRPLCSLLSTQRGSDAASANRGDPGTSARSSSGCRMTSPGGPTPSPFSPSPPSAQGFIEKHEAVPWDCLQPAFSTIQTYPTFSHFLKASLLPSRS